MLCIQLPFPSASSLPLGSGSGLSTGFLGNLHYLNNNNHHLCQIFPYSSVPYMNLIPNVQLLCFLTTKTCRIDTAIINQLLVPFATTTGPLSFFHEHARNRPRETHQSRVLKSGGDFEPSIPSFGLLESRQAPRLAIPLFGSASFPFGAATISRRIKSPSLI